MAYVSTNYETFKGKVLTDPRGGYAGQCVSYVKMACPGIPQTALWTQGAPAKNNTLIAKGTAIATFKDKKYLGHAAIYVSQSKDGLQVWDQWVGHPVAPRTIAFRGGKGDSVNDGDQFYVVD